jgi:ABC-type transport system involved in multi-copper enzyme maturation permease subunit
MHRALILKSWRDHWLLIATALIAALLFEVLFVLAMKKIAPEMLSFARRVEILRRIFQILLSLDLSAAVSPTSLVVLGFLHPFLSAVSWGTLVAIATRLPAGEVDRGTADLLLTLPVPRASVYVATTVVWGLTALALAGATWTGAVLGTLLIPLPGPVDLTRVGMVAANQAAVLMAIGGTSAMVSCLVNHRGPAVAILIAVLLASFLVNFLAVFLPFFETVDFLGLLHYFRPVDIAREGQWPARDLSLLAATAVITWSVGLFVFQRKDIPVG